MKRSRLVRPVVEVLQDVAWGAFGGMVITVAAAIILFGSGL